MALKVSGTTVIDDNANIVSGTPVVTGTFVKASGQLIPPSGATGSRPGSPSAGSIFFDTTEGKLVSYSGTEWV
jgi:hypothetical protein